MFGSPCQILSDRVMQFTASRREATRGSWIAASIGLELLYAGILHVMARVGHQRAGLAVSERVSHLKACLLAMAIQC